MSPVVPMSRHGRWKDSIMNLFQPIQMTGKLLAEAHAGHDQAPTDEEVALFDNLVRELEDKVPGAIGIPKRFLFLEP